jgi:hypothetical protein
MSRRRGRSSLEVAAIAKNWHEDADLDPRQRQRVTTFVRGFISYTILLAHSRSQLLARFNEVEKALARIAGMALAETILSRAGQTAGSTWVRVAEYCRLSFATVIVVRRMTVRPMMFAVTASAF